MNTALILALIEKILIYGVPAVVQAIQAWDVDDPTVEDIKALEILKDPEDYFDDDTGTSDR